MGRLGLIALAALLACGACRGHAAREAEPAPAKGREDPFAEARRRIEEARALPVPAGNYRVSVERIWFAEERATGIGAMFRYADEHVDARVGEALPGAGFRIGVVKDGFEGALEAYLRNESGATREQVDLLMAPGYEATLEIGTTRFFQPFSVGGRQGGIVLPAGQFVGTALAASIVPAGPGRVQVELTPVFSTLGPRGETIEATRAATVAVVPLGQPFLLASQDRTADSVVTELLSRRTEEGTWQAALLLTVTGG